METHFKKAITKLQAIIIALIIIVAVVAAAYYVSVPPVPTPIKQELIIGTTDRPTTLDPGSLLTSAAAWLDSFVLDTLVRNNPETNEIEPWLAKSWEISEDGKTIDFYLEEGVMWHDGTEFTAEDVKFTIDREFHLLGVMNYLITMNVEGAEVIDTYHVRITTKYNMPIIMLRIFTCSLYAMVPKENIRQTAGNMTAWGDEAWGYDVFVGTGPYKLLEYVRDQRLVFERNDNYWAKRKGFDPTLDKIVYKMIGDAATLRMALEKKEIDITWRGLDPLDIPALIANPDIEVYETPFDLQSLELFPAADPILNNTKVRQAIAYAVDIEEVLEKGWKNRGTLTYSHIPSLAPFWYLPTFEKYHHDPEKAMQLLAEAGYPDGFETDMYLMSEYVDVATVIKQNLKEVGIKLNLHLVDRVELRSMRRGGEVPIECAWWWPDYADPHNWETELIEYHMDYAGWSGPALERYLEVAELAKEESDDNVRKTYYDELQQIAAEEVWIYPIAYTYKSTAAQKYVKDFYHYYNFYSEIFGYGYCSIEKP